MDLIKKAKKVKDRLDPACIVALGEPESGILSSFWFLLDSYISFKKNINSYGLYFRGIPEDIDKSIKEIDSYVESICDKILAYNVYIMIYDREMDNPKSKSMGSTYIKRAKLRAKTAEKTDIEIGKIEESLKKLNISKRESLYGFFLYYADKVFGYNKENNDGR